MGEFIDTMENLGYGFLIAIVIVALLMLSISAICSNKKFNAISYIIAIVLLIPLTILMSRLIGACQLHNTTSTIEDLVGYVSPVLSRFISADDHEIGWFIFYRVLWSVLFIIAAVIGICCTMDTRKRRTHRSDSSRERIPSRRDDDRGTYRRRY